MLCNCLECESLTPRSPQQHLLLCDICSQGFSCDKQLQAHKGQHSTLFSACRRRRNNFWEAAAVGFTVQELVHNTEIRLRSPTQVKREEAAAAAAKRKREQQLAEGRHCRRRQQNSLQEGNQQRPPPPLTSQENDNPYARPFLDLRSRSRRQSRPPLTASNHSEQGSVCNKLVWPSPGRESRTQAGKKEQHVESKSKASLKVNIHKSQHFSRRSSRKNTENIATRNKNCVCIDCRIVFASQDSLDSHFCQNWSKNMVRCGVCQAIFRKNLLRSHMKCHESEDRKPFLCSNCGMCFTNMIALMRHTSINHRRPAASSVNAKNNRDHRYESDASPKMRAQSKVTAGKRRPPEPRIIHHRRRNRCTAADTEGLGERSGDGCEASVSGGGGGGGGGFCCNPCGISFKTRRELEEHQAEPSFQHIMDARLPPLRSRRRRQSDPPAAAGSLQHAEQPRGRAGSCKQLLQQHTTAQHLELKEAYVDLSAKDGGNLLDWKSSDRSAEPVAVAAACCVTDPESILQMSPEQLELLEALDSFHPSDAAASSGPNSLKMKLFTCRYCSVAFVNRGTLRCHVVASHAPRPSGAAQHQPEVSETKQPRRRQRRRSVPGVGSAGRSFDNENLDSGIASGENVSLPAASPEEQRPRSPAVVVETAECENLSVSSLPPPPPPLNYNDRRLRRQLYQRIFRQNVGTESGGEERMGRDGSIRCEYCLKHLASKAVYKKHISGDHRYVLHVLQTSPSDTPPPTPSHNFLPGSTADCSVESTPVKAAIVPADSSEDALTPPPPPIGEDVIRVTSSAVIQQSSAAAAAAAALALDSSSSSREGEDEEDTWLVDCERCGKPFENSAILAKHVALDHRFTINKPPPMAGKAVFTVSKNTD